MTINNDDLIKLLKEATQATIDASDLPQINIIKSKLSKIKTWFYNLFSK